MSFAQSPWLRTFKTPPGAAKIDLVCCPAAGGAASLYHAIATELAPTVSVAAVQYPGRQDRLGDPMIDNIVGLSEEIARAILKCRTSPPSRRLALFGHSMGATVAFETARRLAEGKQEPAHVIISGRIPPHRTLDTVVHQGSDETLIGELERLANDPASVQILREVPEIAEMVLPSVRNDYKAVETYRFEAKSDGPALSCPITVFVADDDPTVTIEQAREWAQHTSGELNVVTFSGRHFYLDEQPAAVAKHITEVLL
ncbi:thioesterase II family protein [Hoyosella rhizosphaerae]|uniref:Thioesterase TesA n=1 Tax=Hoyosella rhizosphaerae TaxID=1755582 RepID=A0A916UA12_9ACTN|nr:alpha/beta fold hydrolase [Hoyosella rhizosphaerae]GGC65367.1 oleoyl-ACP hydrolase [Hoyosella rhizosphaerae]